MKENEQARVKSTDTRVAPRIVREVLRSHGTPLDPGVRRDMEPLFGHDFGSVRVHTGEQAAASADAVDASAYATGSNIVFGRGQFAPETAPGRRLLAHELAHTVQQRNSGPVSAELPVSDPGGRPEKEAEGAVQSVAAHRQASLTPSNPAVARQPKQEGKEATEGPAGLDEVEQELTKFFKAVKRAAPKESLPRNQRVITQVVELARSAKPTYRGPRRTLDPNEAQAQMEEFLKSNNAPNDPEKLAKAVVQRLQGPVPRAQMEHLKNQNVFKPSPPKGVAGMKDRWDKGAPADMPARSPVEVHDEQEQSAAMGTQKTNPTMSPMIDPKRTGTAIFGSSVEKEKPEFKGYPAPKAEEASEPVGVVNKDIKLESTVPALTVTRPIHFELNRPSAVVSGAKALHASLTPGGATDLDMVIQWLKKGPQYGVQLTGMASREGPPKHNTELGEYRARSVAKALLHAGISAAQIDDVPGRPETCTRLDFGIYNCGDSRASEKIDPNDRRVEARLFVFPKSVKP
jgi:hypothetical protein